MEDDDRTTSTGDDVCSMIITAVADAADVPATELTPPLYDVIDPDALESLFTDRRGRETPTTLSFEYGDYAVTVLGRDGETMVDVQPLSEATELRRENE